MLRVNEESNQPDYSIGEITTEENAVSFHPKSKMVRFRKSWQWVIWANLFFNVAICIVLLCVSHDVFMGAINGAMAIGMAFLLRWSHHQLHGGAQVKPIIRLKPEGLEVDGAMTFGTIPWDEIATARPTHVFGVPAVCLVIKDWRSLRQREGVIRKMLWAAWVPGGLALSCVPFSQSPKDLAERINRYRERGI